MRSHSPRHAPDPQLTHAPLWLAASEGRTLHRDVAELIGHSAGPEAQLEIRFFGITEAEQRAALAAFPGGRRFTLLRPD